MTDFPTLDGTAVRRLLIEVAATLRERRLVAAQAAWHWHHDQPSIRANAFV